MKRGTHEHPKFLDLTARLGCRPSQAVGHLELLWHFAAKFAPDGAIGKWTNGAIARAADWTEDPDIFVRAIVDSGWVDEHSDEAVRLVVHDWRDHVDDAVHMSLARAKKRFADGSTPKLGRLPEKERKDAEAFYSVITTVRTTDTLREHGVSTDSARRVVAPPPPAPPPPPSLWPGAARARPTPPTTDHEPPTELDQPPDPRPAQAAERHRAVLAEAQPTVERFREPRFGIERAHWELEYARLAADFGWPVVEKALGRLVDRKHWQAKIRDPKAWWKNRAIEQAAAEVDAEQAAPSGRAAEAEALRRDELSQWGY